MNSTAAAITGVLVVLKQLVQEREAGEEQYELHKLGDLVREHNGDRVAALVSFLKSPHEDLELDIQALGALHEVDGSRMEQDTAVTPAEKQAVAQAYSIKTQLGILLEGLLMGQGGPAEQWLQHAIQSYDIPLDQQAACLAKLQRELESYS